MGELVVGSGLTRVACRTCVNLGKSATPSPRIAMEDSSSDSELRSDATLAGRGEAFIVAAQLDNSLFEIAWPNGSR